MTPISPHKDAQWEAGFSLLEILVTLTLMSLLVSIVGVQLFNSVNAARFSRTSHAAIADIKSLRAKAIIDRQDILITQQEIGLQANRNIQYYRFDVPDNWEVEGEPIQISKSGLCSGGYITFKNPEGRQVSYTLSAPLCVSIRDL